MGDSNPMTPEKWQQVKDVLAAALEQPPQARRSYLDRVCSDPALRREVESLIVAQEQGTATFSLNESDVARVQLTSGAKFAHYEIISRLGAGGMGLVYKARDTRLGRFVALKFLQPGDTGDQTARIRLVREAQSASALSHPNVATIYEVGEHDDQVYIAMEFVDGNSLDSILRRSALPYETTIHYAEQICAALSHAHDRGIVHRDLKPSNVVISADGHAKVLDFGLAKRSSGEIVEATTSQLSLTKPGTIVGTLRYMSPEQLRGEVADARSDIWALGVTIYEMATGDHPFKGVTNYEITSAILRDPPKLPIETVPAGLQSIIQRCLAKQREKRYQHAGEVGAALEAIDSVTSFHVRPRDTRPKLRLWMAAVAACMVALVAFAIFEFANQKISAPVPASQEKWGQLTDFADSAVSPALSPDGKLLAFIRGPDTFFGPGQIEAMVLPNGEPVQLTHDGRMKMSPEFSPDGSNIAYTATSVRTWDTWTVPVLGGETHLMFPNTEGLTWIDNNQILFSEIKTGIHMGLMTATQNRTDARDIYLPARDRGMAHRSAISPDRKWVLVSEMDNGGWLPCRLVPFSGTDSGRRVGPPGGSCTYIAWSPDGKWMYFNSDSGGRFHIWRQHFPDGHPEQLTSGATEEEGLAITPDGKSLITSVGERESELWVRDAKDEREISSEGYAENPRFSSDGKKLYYQVRRYGVTGKFSSGELWVADLATGQSEHLLPGTLISDFDISPDNKQVVFSSTDQQEVSRIWVSPLDLSSSPRLISSSGGEDEPRWSTDGYVYFRAAESKLNFLYRMKPDGSARTKVLSEPVIEFDSLMPDGRWAIGPEATGPNGTAQAVVVSLDGKSHKIICRGYCASGWTPGGKFFSLSLVTMEGVFTMLVPVSAEKEIPDLPPDGLETRAQMEAVKGAKVVDGAVTWGPTPNLSASLRQQTHRNLFRIPLQ